MIKKLALSVAAVVVVVGAIYVLPSALPSTTPDAADQASKIALPLPLTPSVDSTPTTGASAAVVTVPGLNGPRDIPATPPSSTDRGTSPSRPSAPADLTSASVLTTSATVAYTTVSPPPVAVAPAVTPPATSVMTTTRPPATSAPARPAPAQAAATPLPTTAAPAAAPVVKIARPAPSTAGAKPKPVAIVTPKPAVTVTPTPKPVVRATVRATPKPAARAPAAQAAPAPQFGIPVTIGNAAQLITVRASSKYSTMGTLVAWQKQANGRWTSAFGPVTAHLGSEGVGTPSEYHSRTPLGTYGLTEAFGRNPNPGTSLPYSHVTTRDWWVSDVNSSQYNTHQICSAASCPFDTGAGENLYNAGSVYNYAVVMDVNRWPATRGDGSAFFLHVTDGGSTAGCVAINAGTLVSIMRWLKPSGHPRIAVGIG